MDSGMPIAMAPGGSAGVGTVLNGHKTYVIDGHTADLIVVLARAPQGLSLFTVDGDAAGLTRRSLKPMDATRKFARLEFNGVAATPLGTAGGAAAPFARTMIEAAACLANEMVGGADRLREDALAYAMMRMQFGKPIASFQSMKHKQADIPPPSRRPRCALPRRRRAAIDCRPRDIPFA
jgi:alkylation response protein AidB-like acyl-CoA dehydrogenase